MTEAPTRIKVLCVDDHPIVRQGIATLLSVEPDMELVSEAADGREAIQQFRAHRPDITLMDLQMPGMGGIDAIGAIRAEFPDAQIIVLTTYAGDAQAQRALQAGACGYLLKNALHKELLDAIRSVHGGRTALPSQGSYEKAAHLGHEGLAPAEIGLLRFIAEGNAYADIARTLGVSDETVESQVHSILGKLDAQDQAWSGSAALEQVMVQAERAARFAAEAANQAKSQFLAGMSHELRTPLNAILGYAQLLAMEEGLSPRQLRGLDTIQQSGQHLLALINDILDLARIEAGRTELNPEPVKLLDLLQSVVNLMRIKADEKRLTLAFDAAPGLPEAVLADERRLRQVLLNLLANAIKFTDHGSVCLHAAAQPLQASQWLLRLEVQDSGVGMAADELGRIFRPFEQVGDVRRRSGGTGLGLAITRALINDMGGQIRVASEPGCGATFSVDLPLPAVLPAAGRAREFIGPARYEGPPRRVLVVDDVAANREMLLDFLGDAGFEVAQAQDGSELLKAARDFMPDLILMDSVMSSVDGLEATRRLRQDGGFDKLPVIAISASAAVEQRMASLQAGVSVFLTKPVPLQVLRTHIGEQLGLRWLAPDVASG